MVLVRDPQHWAVLDVRNSEHVFWSRSADREHEQAVVLFRIVRYQRTFCLLLRAGDSSDALGSYPVGSRVREWPGWNDPDTKKCHHRSLNTATYCRLITNNGLYLHQKTTIYRLAVHLAGIHPWYNCLALVSVKRQLEIKHKHVLYYYYYCIYQFIRSLKVQ